MYFAKVLAALAASTIVAAQVVLTNSDYSGITIGVPLEISWAGNTGTVKLLLKNGLADNQALVGTIAEGLTGNSFKWTPQGPAGTYNLEIQDSVPGSAVNYSPQFQVAVGGISPVPTTYSEATYPAVVPTTSAEATYPVVVPTTSSEPVLTIQTSTNYDASTTVEATTVVESSIIYGTATVIETTVEVTPSYVQPVRPPLGTGPVYVGNVTTSSVIYGNSTINTVTSYSTIDNGVTPTNSVSPIPTSAIVTAMAAHASPMAAMLLGVGGLAFLF